MRLQLLAYLERQAGDGVVIDIRRDGLLLVREVFLHFVLLARDIAGVLDLGFDLLGQHLILEHARTSQQLALVGTGLHQRLVGNIGTFQQV
ncbi:Uncharacterised protein [Bordetella pertussis]|nr:Uncharacterised protein [Bordetella pertussis]CPK84754.1 Uncharacterised protein [Bordetella pertussis]CPO45940.1 Uncharacterised protein [Bordetella pertussis]